MYFDTHAHFDVFDDETLTMVLDRAAEKKVSRILAMGGGEVENQHACHVANQYPGRIWAAVGYDRDQAEKNPSMELLQEQLRNPAVVAVGEIGLDYHYEAETASSQRELFARMLDAARDTRKPIVVHSREADADTISLLREHIRAWKGDADRVGVLHCFTGTLDFAHKILDLGMLISFSGILSFKNAVSLQEVARALPLESLLIETDTPYLAPVPFRGKRNEPAFVVHVAEALAKFRNDSLEHIAHITARNGVNLFGLER